MSDRGNDKSGAPIRHIPFADSPGIVFGRSFGDHYITRDAKQYPLLAEQFKVTVYPAGNSLLPPGDGGGWGYEPHVEIQVFIGGKWETRARTFIGK